MHLCRAGSMCAVALLVALALGPIPAAGQHAWIHLDVTGEDGTVVRWMVETGAPNAMFRRGFRKDSLPVGTEILIDGYQAKSGKNMANGRNITYSALMGFVAEPQETQVPFVGHIRG